MGFVVFHYVITYQSSRLNTTIVSIHEYVRIKTHLYNVRIKVRS